MNFPEIEAESVAKQFVHQTLSNCDLNLFFIYLFVSSAKALIEKEEKKKKKRNTHTQTKKKGLQSCINNSKAPEKNSKLLPNHLH